MLYSTHMWYTVFLYVSHMYSITLWLDLYSDLFLWEIIYD